MSSKKPLRENSFDGAPAGNAGTVNYSTGWGTHASPAVSQTPSRFDSSHRNTGDVQTGGPAGGKGIADDSTQQDKLQKGVNQLFQKQDTPTPDEVASALQFELGKMITKDKNRAKEIVLTNLKKDPHHYSNLHMLNVDDKKMSVNEHLKNVNKTEVVKIFQEIAEERPKRYAVKPEVSTIIQDMWQRRKERSLWKRGQTSSVPTE